MRRLFLLSLSLIACAALQPVAIAESGAPSAEVQQLKSLRALLTQEKFQKSGSRSLTAYFTRIAAEYRAAGYPNIARLLEQSAPQAVSALDNSQTGCSLTRTRQLARHLSRAVADQSASVSGAMPDYLQLASIFAIDLSKAAKNVINGRPPTQGIGESPKLSFTTTSANLQSGYITSGDQEYRASGSNSSYSDTAAVTVTNSGTLTTGGGGGGGGVLTFANGGTVTISGAVLVPSPTPIDSSSSGDTAGLTKAGTGTLTLGGGTLTVDGSTWTSSGNATLAGTVLVPSPTPTDSIQTGGTATLTIMAASPTPSPTP